MSSTGECLANLKSSGTMSDLTITFQGAQRSIRCHRSLLSMRSPVFEAMLNGPMAVGSELVLPEDNPDAFEWMLKHLYRDDQEFPQEMAMAAQVFCLAHKYQIDAITERYEKYMKEEVDAKKFTLVFNTAVLLENETSLLACEEVLVHSTDDILKSPQLSILSGSAFRLLIGHRALAPSSETLVVEAITQWVKTQLENKRALEYEALNDDLKPCLKTFTTPDLSECALQKILQALPKTESSPCEADMSKVEAITDEELKETEPMGNYVTQATVKGHHSLFCQGVNKFLSKLDDIEQKVRSNKFAVLVLLLLILLNATAYVIEQQNLPLGPQTDDGFPPGFYPVQGLEEHLRPYFVNGVWDRLEGRLFSKVGEGGQSGVYRCPWPNFTFGAVLKESKDAANSHHEASFLAYLEGAGGAPRLIAYNSSTGYMLTEFVPAIDMFTSMFVGLSKGKLLLMFISLTNRLKELHDLDVVHGDLKPNNVLVSFDAQGRPSTRIIDFGLSTLSGRRGGVVHRRDDWRDQVAGRPWYSAEFFQGKILDTRSDIPGLAYSMMMLMPGMEWECGRLYNLTSRAKAYRPEDRPSLDEFLEVLRWELLRLAWCWMSVKINFDVSTDRC